MKASAGTVTGSNHMTKLDFSVIERAKLTQQEFADAVDVSRVTTNKWVGYKMSPNRYIRRQVAELLDALEEAIKSEKLPLPSGLPKHQRTEALRAVIGTKSHATN